MYPKTNSVGTFADKLLEFWFGMTVSSVRSIGERPQSISYASCIFREPKVMRLIAKKSMKLGILLWSVG